MSPFPGRAEQLDASRLSTLLAETRPGVEGLPRRLLLETVLLRPHAPALMYRNEVRFYREIRPTLSIEAPRSFAHHFDEESGHFGLLMEDLGARGAHFPDATRELPVDAARGLELVKDQVARHPFKADLIAPLGRSLDELFAALWTLQEVLEGEPTALLHGDPHIANAYLLPHDQGGLLDWQLMERGRWAHDVTSLLVTGLTAEQRRRHGRELLAHSLTCLGEAGVQEVPEPEAALTLYRQSVIWGLFIGWLITPPANYGEAITVANLQRLVAAARDLDTLAALDALGGGSA